jgi:hypothetical protein
MSALSDLKDTFFGDAMMFRIAIAGGIASAFIVCAEAQPLPVRAFAQLERNSAMQISPDGTKVATLSNMNGRYGIVIKSLVDPKAKPVVFAPQPSRLELRWIKWANNDWLLASQGLLYDRGYFGHRTREARLLSIAADGSKAFNPVKPGKEKPIGSLVPQQSAFLSAVNQDNVIDWSPEDDKTILLSIYENQTSDTAATVRKIDVATGNFSQIMSGRRDIGYYQADANGQVRVGWGRVISGDRIVNFYDYRTPDSNWVARKTSPLLAADFNLLYFYKDPRFAYVLGPVNGRRALLKWDMMTDAS